jgi:hypothetical protein
MKTLLSVAVLAATLSAYAQGTSQAILSYSNTISAFSPGTVGWTFQAKADLTVTELGCFAYIFNDNPTVTGIQVGLWSPGGLLLASNLVTPSSVLFDQTRYESIAPTSLSPGSVYSIGISALSGGLGLNVAGAAAEGTISSSASITLRGAASVLAPFTYPPEVAGTLGTIYAGPNFRYQGGVPEPSSWALMSLGGLFLFALRLRRKR